jgi:hypothetical protein
VRDKKVAELLLLLQVLEKVHDLGADRHVQGGYRLVKDDQLGIRRQGSGESDPLPLAPAELVGESIGGVRRQPHLTEHLPHAVPLLGG